MARKQEAVTSWWFDKSPRAQTTGTFLVYFIKALRGGIACKLRLRDRLPMSTSALLLSLDMSCMASFALCPAHKVLPIAMRRVLGVKGQCTARQRETVPDNHHVTPRYSGVQLSLLELPYLTNARFIESVCLSITLIALEKYSLLRTHCRRDFVLSFSLL